MENMELIRNLNDWFYFVPVIDFLIDRNLDIPKNLNNLEPKVYHQALAHLDRIERNNLEMEMKYRIIEIKEVA